MSNIRNLSVLYLSPYHLSSYAHFNINKYMDGLIRTDISMEENFKNISWGSEFLEEIREELEPCCEYAMDCDCDVIIFDDNAPIISDLPVYEEDSCRYSYEGVLPYE